MYFLISFLIAAVIFAAVIVFTRRNKAKYAVLKHSDLDGVNSYLVVRYNDCKTYANIYIDYDIVFTGTKDTCESYKQEQFTK